MGCGGNNTKPSYSGYGAKVDEKTKGPHNTHTASQAEVHKIINRLHPTIDNLILGREHTKKLEDILFNIENWNVEQKKEILNSVLEDGQTILLKTIKSLKSDHNNKDKLDLVFCIARHSLVDLNQTGNEKLSPILLALEDDIPQAVLALLEASNINKKPLLTLNYTHPRTGDNPLHMAASKGYEDLVKKFLVQNQEFNRRNKAGKTALQLAAEGRHLDIVEFLIQEKGVDIRAPGHCNIFHWATQKNNVPVMEVLLKAPSDTLRLFSLNKKYHANKILDNQGEKGEILLNQKVQEGAQDVVACLLKHPDIDPNTIDSSGFTPIAIAANNAFTEIVKLLIQHPKINVDKQSNNLDKDTPLHRAVLNKNYDIVSLILEKSTSNLCLPNESLNTPFHIAAEVIENEHDKEMLGLLIKKWPKTETELIYFLFTVTNKVNKSVVSILNTLVKEQKIQHDRYFIKNYWKAREQEQETRKLQG